VETCYEILGVSRDATPDEIRAAYRRLAKQCHPDINQDPDANERFIAIQQAYETLIDPDARARYDIALQGGAGPAPHDPFRYQAAGGSEFSWSWRMPASGSGRAGFIVRLFFWGVLVVLMFMLSLLFRAVAGCLRRQVSR